MRRPLVSKPPPPPVEVKANPVPANPVPAEVDIPPQEKAADREPDFRNATWGMSVDEVKQREDASLDYESSNIVIFTDSIAGLDCSVVYVFVDDKLVRTKYNFNAAHTNKNLYISDFRNLQHLLTSQPLYL